MPKRLQSLIVLGLLAVFGAWTGIAGARWLRGSAAAPSTAPPEATGDPYADDLRHLAWLVREKWSWLELREAQGLDLDALLDAALVESGEQADARGFLRALRRFVAGLRDGHGHVELEGTDLDEERQWPFSLVEVAEGIMVDGIDPGVFRSKALKRGDLILEVDDEPIDAHIARQEALVFASTDAARRRAALFALTENTENVSLRVRAQRMGEDAPTTVEVTCPPQSAPVPRRSWRPSPDSLADLTDDTAYFRVASFAPDDPRFADADPETRLEILDDRFAAFAEAFGTVSPRARLILDLRGNGGGTDLLGQALCLHLMKPGFRYVKLSAKRGGTWHDTDWLTPEVGRGEPRFAGRLVCLIDERSLSVTDNVASSLRDEHPNVTFVGQPTGGGSGAPRTFTLPATGAEVTFCTMRVYAPNGTPIEGQGVQPDLLVRPTRAQLLAGDDAAMQKALSLID